MGREDRIAKQRRRRQYRVRAAQRKSSRLRASVFRSNKSFSVQIIDDTRGITVVAASTSELTDSDGVRNYGNCAAAAAVGRLIATKVIAAGITEIRQDRGQYRYHGRVQAFADAARGEGLLF